MDPINSPHVYLTGRFFKAMAYATDAHREQVRKSTNIAYISHPFGVAALVLETGGDEDQAIGGLLHDVAEDCGGEPRLIEIAALFGDRVAHIVRGCSDSLVVDEALRPSWEDRKESYLQHLGSDDADILLVSAADKTHNARAIATDIQSIGDQVWERFTPNQGQILWYYRSLLRLFTERDVTPALLNPLGAAIAVMDHSRLAEVKG